MQRAALLVSSFLLLTAACAAEPADTSASATDVSEAPVRRIYTGANSSRQLAGDARFVYSTDSAAQEVRRTPRAGGDSVTLWHGHGMDSTGGIAVDDGVVYFNEDGRILAVPAEGGAVRELVRLRKEGPTYLAASGDYVYWGGETDFAVGYDSYIRRVKKTGGAYETVYTGYQGVTTFAVADGKVYFGGIDHSVIMNAPERLMRVDGAGGTPVQLFETPRLINALTVDGENAYVAVADGGWTVQAIPLAGGAPRVLASLPLVGTNEPHDLAVTSDTLYWTSPGTFDFAKADPDNHDAHVWSVPKKTGGTPSLVASDIASPESLAVAGSCPVWSAKTAIETPSACR